MDTTRMLEITSEANTRLATDFVLNPFVVFVLSTAATLFVIWKIFQFFRWLHWFIGRHPKLEKSMDLIATIVFLALIMSSVVLIWTGILVTAFMDPEQGFRIFLYGIWLFWMTMLAPR